MKLKVNVMKSLTTMFFSALTITGVSATNALQGAPNQNAQPVTFPAEVSLFIPPEPVAPPPPQEMLQALPQKGLQISWYCDGYQLQTYAAPAQALPRKVLQMPILNYGGYQPEPVAPPPPQEMLQALPGEMLSARARISEELDKDCYKGYFDKCKTEYNKKGKKKGKIYEVLASNINNARVNGNLEGIFAHLKANYDTSNINIPAEQGEASDYMFIESFLYYNPDAFNDPVLQPIVQNVWLKRNPDKEARQKRISCYDFAYREKKESDLARKINSLKRSRSLLLKYVQKTYNVPKKTSVSVREACRSNSASFTYFWEIFKACPEALNDPIIRETFQEPVVPQDLVF